MEHYLCINHTYIIKHKIRTRTQTAIRALCSEGEDGEIVNHSSVNIGQSK